MQTSTHPGKSFTGLVFVGKTKTLCGSAPFIGTTHQTTDGGSVRRICENCNHRQHPAQPERCDTSAIHRLLQIPLGNAVPKRIDGQQVGNFCPCFSATELSVFYAEAKTAEKTEEPGDQIVETPVAEMRPAELAAAKNFVASKNGGKYYPVGSSGEKRIREENRIYFETALDAELAGYNKAA